MLLVMRGRLFKASERRRPNFPKIGHCDHFILDRINEMTRLIYGEINFLKGFVKVLLKVVD
jgi:hypothetical protein